MATPHSISIVGLGLMGAALARAAIKAGYKTTVWNRTIAKAQPLADLGAFATTSASKCIQSSPHLCVTCLVSAPALYEVLEGLNPEDCEDRVLVDFTSATLSQTRRAQELVARLKFSAYIRGHIPSTPAYLGSPDITLSYSGNERAFDSVRRELASFGQVDYLGADPTLATLHEIVVGNVFSGITLGFLQAMAVLKSSDTYAPGEAQRYMSTAIRPFLTQDCPNIFGDLAKQIDERDYVTKGDGVRLDTMAQVVELLMKTDQEQMVSSEAVSVPLLKLLQARISQGGAAEELSSLVETIAGTTKLP
ncbi:NAD binding domain-containing protein [Cladophialophora immunda]|nr:NAD binding domain-containing protein [Cladophialophora immunda]